MTELADRLSRHADLHEHQPWADEEQMQFARDLREAAALITELARLRAVEPAACSYPHCNGEAPEDQSCCRMPFTSAMAEAAERYWRSVGRFAHPLPAEFRWVDCFNAMITAAPPAQPAEPVQPGWRDIESAPKGGCLIDILLPDGKRWAGCHYDAICDQWRNIGPSGHMVTVRADYATHWMPIPPAPKATK